MYPPVGGPLITTVMEAEELDPCTGGADWRLRPSDRREEPSRRCAADDVKAVRTKVYVPGARSGFRIRFMSKGDDSSAKANCSSVKSGAVHTCTTFSFPLGCTSPLRTTTPSSTFARTSGSGTVTAGGDPRMMVTWVVAVPNLRKREANTNEHRSEHSAHAPKGNTSHASHPVHSSG
jgi:hypothetical protein